MFKPYLLFFHLCSVIMWVGGMFFAYFSLRPAAAKLLDPPKRLPLWVATFDSFFKMTAVAVVVILVTGFTMFLQVGFKTAPLGWNIMMTFGLVMSAIFIYVYGVLYPKLRGHCAASNWPAAGAALNAIRQMVALNLTLGLCTIAAAMLIR